MRADAAVHLLHGDPPTEPRPAPEDTAALEEAYRTWYPSVVEYCRRCLHGHGDPEAVAQEAFVRAWLTPDRFRGTRFHAWVSTFARRLCIDATRHAAVAQASGSAIGNTTERWVEAADEVVERDEEQRLALEALRRLPPGYRRVIALRDLNGWSYDEIARAEGTSIESVRSALWRARAALRAAYAKLIATGQGWAVVRWWQAVRRRLPWYRESRLLAPWLHMGGAGDLAVGLAVMGLLAAGGPPPAGAATAAAASQPTPVTTSAPVPLRTERATATAVTPTSVPQGDTRRPSGEPPTTGVLDMATTLLPAQDDDTATVSFTDITPSPRYEEDGTIFATGNPSSFRFALFRSTDRGATWKRLLGAGFVGGHILLPPAYPDDPRIFVSGATAFQVSLDGGTSFVPLAGVGAYDNVAISPDFARDGRIVIGQAPGLEYRDGLGAVVPWGLPPQQRWFRPAFSPAYADDGVMFVGTANTLTRCAAALCGEAVPIPYVGTLPEIVLSPGFATDGLVGANFAKSVVVSRDGGRSYQPVTLPLAGDVSDVAFDGRGRLFAAVLHITGTSEGTRGGLALSADGGQSWRVLTEGTPLERGVVAVAALADGRILASRHRNEGGAGLWCSVDDGATWHRRCPG